MTTTPSFHLLAHALATNPTSRCISHTPAGPSTRHPRSLRQQRWFPTRLGKSYGLVVLFLFLPLAESAAQPEIQINTYTTSFQERPDVATLDDGSFVVVWASDGSTGDDTSAYSVQGHQLSPSGSPSGEEFQINSSTSLYQWFPAVAAAGDHGFVVVWQGYGPTQEGAQYRLRGQRYASLGVPLGGEFLIDEMSEFYQRHAKVAGRPDGSFIVVWEEVDFALTDSEILLRQFDVDGEPLGPPTLVNSYTTERQIRPDLALLSDGGMVVVWESFASPTDASGLSIQGQRFFSDGTVHGAQFQVNALTSLSQFYPAVTGMPDGGFKVVFSSGTSSGDDTSSSSIQLRSFDSLGVAVSEEMQVNHNTPGSQEIPAIASAPDGSFLVVWNETDFTAEESDFRIRARQFRSDGLPWPEVGLNAYTTGNQYRPSVTAGADGKFTVSWMSHGSFGTDTSETSIQKTSVHPILFADGFESGDTGAWSSSVP